MRTNDPGKTLRALAIGAALALPSSAVFSQPQFPTVPIPASLAGKLEHVTVHGKSLDGKPVPDVVARWAANAPLTMVHQYIPQLREYSGLALDAGDDDRGIADTVRALDKILTDYGVNHVAEIYPGDHVNRIDQRLEKKVLPFFSAHLAFK